MNKYLAIVSGVIALIVLGYLIWQFSTPVEIVAVHNGNTLLVKHFPYLKDQKISWWEANKAMIKEKYNIPHEKPNGDYRVYIQDFGLGYRIDKNREEDGDLLCFDDMTVAANCIEKSPVLTIGRSQNTGVFYW